MDVNELKSVTRNKLIDAAIIGASIFFIPALIASFHQVFSVGNKIQFAFYILCSLFLYLILIFRKRIKLEIKTHFFLSLFIVISLGALFNYKLAGGFYFFMIPIVIGTLVLGIKAGIFYLMVFLVFYIVLAFLHQNGIIPNQIDFNHYLNTDIIWISRGLGIIFASAIIIYLSNLYEKYFTKSLMASELKSEELEEALKQLRYSEKRFRLFIDNYPFPISIKDEKYNLVYRNKAIIELFDNKEINKDVFHGQLSLFNDSIEKIEEADKSVLNNQKIVELELEGEYPRGRIISCRIIKFPLHNQEGDRLVGSITIDTTKERRAEKQLELSEIKYRSIIEGSNDGFVLFDDDFNILEANKSFLLMTGYPKEFIRLIDVRLLLGNRYDELKTQYDRFARADKNWSSGVFELELIRAYGNILPVEINIYKLVLDHALITWAVIHDISERKQMDLNIYREIVKSEEKERERYARELHDGLGPILSTCNIYLHAIANEKNISKHSEYIERASALLNDAFITIREISNNLSPDILKKYGLMQAIQSFIEKIGNISAIHFNLKTNLEKRISELIEFTIFRTIIELINNSIKYSGCSEISIEINIDRKKLLVRYKDNGKGFDYHAAISAGKGFGLLNIETRIRKIGGDYIYRSEPGAGVDVLLKFDLKYI